MGVGGESQALEVLWEDAERVFCRLGRGDAEGHRHAFIPVLPDGEHPTIESINRLTHEYELRDYLDGAWALQPVEFVREPGQTMLVVEYAGGEPLDRLIGQPMEIGRFLRLAVALSAALGRLHGAGLIHKDIKPANVLVRSRDGASLAHRLRHYVSPPARAPAARTSRVHRRNARLYGARANGTSESLSRFPERPLLTWSHLLRNADRQSSVHGVRSDGMGALPYCETAGTTQRATERVSRRRSPQSR